MPSSRRAIVIVAAVIAVLGVGGLTTWAVVSGNDHSSTGSGSGPTVARNCLSTSSSLADGGGAVDTVAPDFTLPSLAGDRCVTLRDLRGHPVILNFWASWCNPCRREFPLLRTTIRSERSNGLEIVGVTYRDILGDARQFAASQHATWTLLHDDDGDVAAAYGVRAIPQTLFIRRDGTVSARFYGMLSEHELATELARIER